MKSSHVIKLLVGMLWLTVACNRSENAAAPDAGAEAGYSELVSEALESAETDAYSKASNGAEPKAMEFPDKATVDVPPSKHAEYMMKEGSMGLKMKSYTKDLQSVRDQIVKSGGYIASESESREVQRIQNNLVVRVPSPKFDALVQSLSDLADNVDFKNINVTDVSEEFIDIESRLKTKKEVEQTYIGFLSRARNIEEVLKVENELRVIREEIESREGRLRFLKDRIAYSTLNLNVYEDLDFTGSISKKPGFFNKIGEGLATGWKGVLNVFIGIVYLWPVWVIVGSLTLFIIRRRRQRMKAQ